MTIPDLPEAQVVEPADALWDSHLQPAGCDQCRQVFLVEAGRLGQVCPNCGRGKLAPQPARLRPEPPELLAPFQKSRSDVLIILQNFVKGVWLHPDDFTAESLFNHATPVFIPMWLVDSDLSGDWQAEVGYDYQVKSSQEAYAGGRWQTREVVETRIRWEPRLGNIIRHYDNITVPALSDHHTLLKMAGDYHRELAGSYQAEKIGHATIRIPDLLPENAWPQAQTNLNQVAAAECQTAAGGQHIRNFNLRVDYHSLHWTQLLFPLYFTYYTDDAGLTHPVMINGQTGKTGGVRLASQRQGWKWAGVLAGIAFLLLILGLACTAAAALLPLLTILGGLLIFLAFVCGTAAITPAIWPWQWNRRQ